MNVVLLHAYPFDPRMWAGQEETLREHDVIAPDLYALGSSMGEWADALLAAVPHEIVLVGASMGGYCALETAARAPERVRGLVLVGSRADAEPPERRAERNERIELIRREGIDALWAQMRPKLFHDDEVAADGEALLERDTGRLVRGLEAVRDREDRTETLARFDHPVLLVLGEHDSFFPPVDARALAAEHEHVSVEVIADCGHLPNLERPAEFDRILRDYLAALPG